MDTTPTSPPPPPPSPSPHPQRICPHCGATIAPHAAEGWCTRCLLASVTNATEGLGHSKGAVQPPDLDTVRSAFPSLEHLELIGTGGMGAVYRARQPKLDRWIALKLLPAEIGRDPAFAERFLREARVLARLSHPNIVAVHDFGQNGDFCFLIMEFVDGANLRQAMRAGRFSAPQALALVPQLCAALQFAHDHGVMHRDIKPENILLDSQGRVKLADFGIAKLLHEPSTQPNLTLTGATLGTPQYMAPEQIERPSDVDHRADIYSLGVVFYELLTGELPLGRFPAPSSKTPLDSRVDDIVLRALAKERDLRQQSANEVRTALEQVDASRPNPNPSPSSQSSHPPAPTPTPTPTATDPRPASLWHMPQLYRQSVLGLTLAYLLLALPGTFRGFAMLGRMLFPLTPTFHPRWADFNLTALGIIAGVMLCLVVATRVIPRTDLWLAPIRLRSNPHPSPLDRWLWISLFAALILFALDSALHTILATSSLVATSLSSPTLGGVSLAFILTCVYPLVLSTAWQRGKTLALRPLNSTPSPLPHWGPNLAALLLALSVLTALLGLLQPHSPTGKPSAVAIGGGMGFLAFCMAWWTGHRFWLGAARVLVAYSTYISLAGFIFLVFWRFNEPPVPLAEPGLIDPNLADLHAFFPWMLVATAGLAVVHILAWISLHQATTRAAFGLLSPSGPRTA